MFSTQAVILQKKTLPKGNIWYLLFSKEFGPITAFGKEKKVLPLDIGIKIFVTLKTERHVSRVISYEIMTQPAYFRWDFRSIDVFLHLLAFLAKTLPAGVPAGNIWAGYDQLLAISPEKVYPFLLAYWYKILLVYGIFETPIGDAQILHTLAKVPLCDCLECFFDTQHEFVRHHVYETSWKYTHKKI